MPAEERAGRAVAVDRLQPGDHAFLAFADDEDRWDILAVFTQQGFARDEKVRLLVDVRGHSPARVAARVAGGAAAARSAQRAGQLVVSNTPRVRARRVRCRAAAAGGTPPDRHRARRGIQRAAHRERDVARAHPGRPTRPGRRVRDRGARGAVPRAAEPRISPRFAPGTSGCSAGPRPCGRRPGRAPGEPAAPARHAAHGRQPSNTLVLTGDIDLSNPGGVRPGRCAHWPGGPRGTLVLDISDLSFFDGHSAAAMLRHGGGAVRAAAARGLVPLPRSGACCTRLGCQVRSGSLSIVIKRL